MKRIVCLIVVMAFLIASLAWTQETGRVIRAQMFVLEDAQGRRGATLKMSRSGTGLFLYDANGNIRVVLSVLEKTNSYGLPNLTLCDEQERPRITLQVNEEELGFRFDDGNAKKRIMITLDNDGPMLILYDEKETMRASLALIRGIPEPILMLFDADGNWTGGVPYTSIAP